MWAIRRHFPSAHLALLSDVHENNNYVLARSILPQQALFDQWLAYPARYEGSSPRGMAKLLFELRRHRFDTLVYLAPRRRTPFQIRRDLLFFYSAGIRTFIGHREFKPLPKKVFDNPIPSLQHEADHLLHRLSLDGIPIPPPGRGEMNLTLTETERSEAHAWLLEHCGEELRLGGLAGIGPGSKWPSKVWPAERFAELGRHLIKEFGLFPVVFGGCEDSELAERLIAEWGQGINAAGLLTIRQAAAALSCCRLYVGNDTGTMHLAAAVGTPCVAVFSAQDYPGRWYPYGNGHVVLRESVPCEACLLKKCDRDMECLKRIGVERMLDACRSICEKAVTA